jgi:Flp pilus assembly protein TadD
MAKTRKESHAKERKGRASTRTSRSAPICAGPEAAVPAKTKKYGRQCFLFLAVLLVFILVALALHYPSFTSPTYYDTRSLLESKEHIFASSDLLTVIRLLPQRPIAMASFYVNYRIWGMDPFFFRLVNAVILGLTAFAAAVAFILILQAAGPSRAGESRQKQAIGIFLGLVFLVHPLQTYYVAYIWQRIELLCCLFYISALALYVAVRAGRVPYVVSGYALCLVLFVLALATKERAVTLPAALVLAEIAFFRNGWKSLLKRIAVFIMILLPLLALLSFLERPYGNVEEYSGLLATITTYYHESGLSLWQVLVSQCRVLFSYLALIIVPVPSNVRLTIAHVVFSSPLETPEIAASVIGALAIVAAGIFLIRKRPLTGFGLLFFLVNWALDSLAVPYYFFFAYRASLPMFGLLLVLGDILLAVWVRVGSLDPRKAQLAAAASACTAAIVIGLLSAVTVSKSKLWNDPVAFWSDIVEGLPSHDKNVEKRVAADALDNLGVALQEQGRQAEAIALFRRAIEVQPLYPYAYVDMAISYAALGDNTQAESSLQQSIRLFPKSADSQFALAKFYMSQGRLALAWHHMQKAAANAPSDPRYMNGLGKILLQEGKPSEAAQYFRKAIETASGYDDAHYNLGDAYVAMGKPQEALRHFTKALELNRRNWQAHNSLGLLLAQSGDTAQAEAHFQEALVLSPRNWSIYNNLGVMLAMSGDLEKAATQFEKALEINPEDPSARQNLLRVRTLIGSPSVK